MTNKKGTTGPDQTRSGSYPHIEQQAFDRRSYIMERHLYSQIVWWLVAGIWTLLIATSAAWSILERREDLLEKAYIQAITLCRIYEKQDLQQKRTGTSEFGRQTFPYSIRTFRQGAQLSGDSLDAWERKAMAVIVSGTTEVKAATEVDSVPFYRLMIAGRQLAAADLASNKLIASSPGERIVYEVSFPLTTLNDAEYPFTLGIISIHFSLYIVGLLAIAFGVRWRSSQKARQQAAARALRESEQRFHTVFNTSPDAVCLTRLSDSLAIEVNAGFCEISGWEYSEVVNHSILELGIWRNPKQRDRMVQILQEHGILENLECEFVRKDGSIIIGLVSARVIDLNGVPHLVSVTRDITERKSIERRIHESEDRYRQMFEKNLAVKLLVDPESGAIVDANSAAAEFYGWPLEKLKQATVFDLNAMSVEEVRAKLNHVREAKTTFLECQQLTANGELKDVEMYTGPVTQNGRTYVYAIFHDITSRKAVEKALKLTQFSVDRSGDAAFWMGGDGRFVYVNEAACRSLEYTREELLQMSVYDIDPDVTKEVWPEVWARNKVVGSRTFESRHRTKSGELFPVELTAIYVQFDGREYNCAFARDITERKVAGRALEESEQKYRDLVERAGIGILVDDASGKLQYFNSKFCSLFGYTPEEMQHLTFRSLIHPDSMEEGEKRHQRHLENNDSSWSYEFTGVRKDGSAFFVGAQVTVLKENGKIVGWRTYLQDITDRRRLEKELARADKLKSVGLLAGGIAHDFNNLLTGMLGNISLTLEELDPSDALYEQLKEAEKAAERARGLTQQLLTFSKGGEPVRKRASISDIISDTVPFVLRGSRIQAIYELPEKLDDVFVDARQISQVVHNIVINAVQAMPEGGQLTVHASVERTVLTENSSANDLAVCLAISDNGPGIPHENRLRIFDPYFTTKEHGNGLGLASSYSIVKKHNGRIEVDSEVGRGSTFRIYLPVAGPDTNQTGGIRIEAVKKVSGGRILVMDDEDFVRELARRILAKHGFEVQCVADGDTAIACYSKAMDSDHPIALAILDLTIPGGLGGRETMERLRAIDPNVKAIVCSGYSNDPILSDWQRYGFAGVVTKPYRPSDLLRAVHNLLKTPLPSHPARIR